MNTLKPVEDSGLLAETDLKYLSEHLSEVQHNWEKNQRFRTDTEMRISVLNQIKFPTPAAKYWQAVREQSVMYSELIRLSFAYKRNNIDITEIEELLKSEKGYEKLRLEVDLEEKRFLKMNMEFEAADRMREIRLWHDIMGELDGDFDKEDVNAHQMESLSKRFELQAELLGPKDTISERINIVGLDRTAKAVRGQNGKI